MTSLTYLQCVTGEVRLLVSPDALSSNNQHQHPEQEERGEPDFTQTGGVMVGCDQLSVEKRPRHPAPTDAQETSGLWSYWTDSWLTILEQWYSLWIPRKMKGRETKEKCNRGRGWTGMKVRGGGGEKAQRQTFMWTDEPQAHDCTTLYYTVLHCTTTTSLLV